jgi:hypothetical protein
MAVRMDAAVPASMPEVAVQLADVLAKLGTVGAVLGRLDDLGHDRVVVQVLANPERDAVVVVGLDPVVQLRVIVRLAALVTGGRGVSHLLSC